MPCLLVVVFLHMNSFSRYLYPENILLNLCVEDKTQALMHIAALMETQHQLDRGKILAGLCAREKLGSTALGQGVAFPHAQISELHRPMMAYVSLATPIDFDSPDGLPVTELFVLLFPSERVSEHLQMLADVAGFVCDLPFRKRLSESLDIASVLDNFASWSIAPAST